MTIAVLGPLVLVTDFSRPTLAILLLSNVLGAGIALLSDFADITGDREQDRFGPKDGERQPFEFNWPFTYTRFINTRKSIFFRAGQIRIKGAAQRPQPY